MIASPAAGCNLEDTDHARGGVREATGQADRLAAFRQTAGDRLVLNARIDVSLGAGDQNSALAEGIDRAQGYFAAGADCVSPVHLRSPELISAFVEAVRPAPVNVTYLPGGPDIATLGKLGVARVSLGAGLWKAGRAWLQRQLGELAAGRAPY